MTKNADVLDCTKPVYGITAFPKALSYEVCFERLKALLNLSTTVSFYRL